MNLSEHFTLEEMTFSQTATRHGVFNNPPPEAVANLVRLAITVLEPLREALGKPIRITSGYRSPVINRLVGGAPESAHVDGRAADIVVPGMRPYDVCRRVQELMRAGLPVDQCIHEAGSAGGWCHAAIPVDHRPPRHEMLTALFSRSGVRYVEGLQEVVA